ncbi:succinate semialdehyde dehydrogenase [Agreia bicolorata]|uniref:Succinate semialdehyde dehydrogenase n=1 Tax=Agreia bicolorata TaxID=110935 RepID=A0A1T4WPZ5_9MICO|nr:NAD-dependent succinate-semialdehyde dehydrogenase [Agreia bicolorata]SKA79434.1 succinate semialdehyde dehydrogenase [Agreia bicolorata]
MSAAEARARSAFRDAADPVFLAASDRVLVSVPPGLRVGGELMVGQRATFAVADPATGATVATVVDATPQDALDAVAIAYESGRAWAATSTRHRSDVLHRAYAILMERRDEIALLITREMGKPLAEARGEVTYASDYVRWYAEEALRPAGNVRPGPEGDVRLLTSRAPVGTCLLITPWNFPMAMATRKIAPALAAGCSVILKPAELTPLTSLLVADIFREAGVPDGLVNVVTTTDAAGLSRAVMADPRVRKVSFTGSTPVGRTLLAQASENLLKTSMELGGNAPLIVFDDADLERAVEGALTAKLRNGGQSCTAANRYLVQEGIADAFIEAFSERMSQIVVGNGLAAGVGLGPVIDQRALDKCTRLVDDAIARGATLATGGKAIDSAGWFFEPTVLVDASDDAEIATTEIFGPVASITRFSTQQEAIDRANDTPFGLSAYVFTQDLDRAFTVADRLETGMVGFNQGIVSNISAPFGGTKHSGLGREGGAEGLEEYQDIRYYAMNRRQTA